MLNPRERQHLLEALRPPEGYALDCAIGTTFSLDLLTLLTVPLAFTLFDTQDGAGRPAGDPLAVLEALRRHADRVHVFCQAGRISVPQSDRLLYGYLEDSIFQVNAPDPAGVFHPKLWVLRFAAPDATVLYRLLCASRNLTFDRCWDTLLQLEGPLVERQRAYAINHPLADFVAALPGLAVHSVPEHVIGNVRRIQDELRRVSFAPPSGLDLKKFWPLGIPRYDGWPFGGRIDRLLIVSPFLSSSFLHDVSEEGNNNVLVSRLESLQALNTADLSGFKHIYHLSPAADLEGPDMEAQEAPVDPLAPLHGLHAKLYVADDGWNARLWTGSANATRAAFYHNVEFLVELEGRKSAFGTGAFLHRGQDQSSFIELLQEYTPPDGITTQDTVLASLEAELETLRRELGRADIQAHVLQIAPAITFRIELRTKEHLSIPNDVSVACWPITIAQALSVRAVSDANVLAAFEAVSFEALSAFFAFELRASREGQTATCRFVLHTSLIGAPADRRERLLRSLLQNRDQLVRFLLFILAEGGPDEAVLLDEIRRFGSESPAALAGRSEIAVFESLVRALSRNPAKLDQVARLVSDLRKTPEGQQLLPADFDSIWEPIWAARQELSR